MENFCCHDPECSFADQPPKGRDHSDDTESKSARCLSALRTLSRRTSWCKRWKEPGRSCDARRTSWSPAISFSVAKDRDGGVYRGYGRRSPRVISEGQCRLHWQAGKAIRARQGFRLATTRCGGGSRASIPEYILRRGRSVNANGHPTREPDEACSAISQGEEQDLRLQEGAIAPADKVQTSSQSASRTSPEKDVSNEPPG